MEFFVFFALAFLVPVYGVANAAARAPRCEEIFLNVQDLQSRLDQNYFYNPGISDLVHRVQKLGVRFEFWDPTENGTLSMRHRYVEPLIVSGFHNNRFIAEETIIYFPYEPQQLFGAKDSNYRTRQTLIRVAHILELQKKGVLFAAGSMEFNARITIIGFSPVLTIEDSALVAISHLFDRFKYRKVSFEPRDSLWEFLDFSPERNYVTNPQDEGEMLIRVAYFDRVDLWESISPDLEQYLFKPERQSLFPYPEEPIN